MQNKAQQGNQNPIPTPEHELERYGVWVKAEPQDVLEEPATGRKTLESSSLDASDILSDEEEDLLDSFELAEEPGQVSSTTDAENDAEAVENLSPLEELGAIEEIETFELEELEPETATADDKFLEELETESLEEIDEIGEDSVKDGVIDLALDDLEYKTPASVAKAQPATPAPSAPESDDFSTTEVNIEDFGFTEDGSSAAGPSLESMGTSDILDAPEPALGLPKESAPGDFDSLDMDLQFDDTIPSTGEFEDTGNDSFVSGPDSSSEFESVDLDSFGMDEASPAQPAKAAPVAAAAPQAAKPFSGEEFALDSFIDSDESGANGIMPELDVENVSIDEGVSGFDDVSAVSDDLSRPSRSAPEPSSDLLQKIALELSSIKEELVSLRSQLSGLKSSAVPSETPFVETETVEETAPGGFFDDEDDDTIALTGDELDNILNTADFTEEPAEDEALDEPELHLELPQGIELLPEDGVYTVQSKPGIETIELPTVEPTLEEFAELESLDGVTPITSSPEDTSFLDTEADDSSLELDGMPLEDVPLVEPNPSDLDIIIDSAFGDEDEVLPTIEPMAAEVEPEIVLDIEAGDKPVVSTVDSFPESLEEIDDAYELEELTSADDFGGMDLHSEPLSPPAADMHPLEEDTFVDLLPDEGDISPTNASTPTKPVEYHPDDVATSLDDSLFVEAASPGQNTAEAETPEELEFLEELDEDLEPVEELVEEPAEVPPAQSVVAEPKPQRPPEHAPATEIEKPSLVESETPDKLKHDVKSVLQYLDQLLASLPEEKIEEFASSEYYDTYKRLFDDLGLI